MTSFRATTCPANGTRKHCSWFRVLVLFVLAGPPNNFTPAADVDSAALRDEQVKFFERSIRPLFVEHCQKCHGAQKQWGGLRLDSKDALLKGGDRGAAIVPGNAEGSLLIRAVRRTDADLKMPPEGQLTTTEIADLVRWINQGAQFPQASKSSVIASRSHWSFQRWDKASLRCNDFPDVLLTPIDSFVAEELTRYSLFPTGPADRTTLIRRITFDVTGLPPTPLAVAEFLADDRPDAFERVLDRLFASPAYGERWGRNWLDVARYADSNGLDENVAYGNAWRYRDYVVASFNRDKPFDRFIHEQLAGDQFPVDEQSAPHKSTDTSQSRRHELLIATGFLGIGGKVLAEVNEAKMQMDIVDELIDSTGRAFLGLTLGCARCHDHKFDPITATDYYGLAGIFSSTKTMESRKKLAKWHENLLESSTATATRTEYQNRLAEKKQAVAAFVESANRKVMEQPGATQKTPDKLESAYPEETKLELKKLRDELALLEKNPPEYPSAMGVAEDQIADSFVNIRGNPLKLGDPVRRQFPRVFLGPNDPVFFSTHSGRKQLAEWLTDPHHPLTSRVFVNRIWRWTFGQGIVRTTDNFGLQGESPSHPQLLNYLASRFMDDSWEVKKLQRLLFCSHTYRQSSEATAEQVARDPSNRFLSRANIRRLSAEEIRDSILAVSGELDKKMGGSLLKLKNREYFFDHTSKDQTTYESTRRSIYLPVVRNHIYDLFYLWDFPDPVVPTGDRPSTTVSPQALMMMNSEFVLQHAREFANHLLVHESDDNSRLERLYQLALGRSPRTEEHSADQSFIEDMKNMPASAPTLSPDTKNPDTKNPDAKNPDTKNQIQDSAEHQAWSTLCQVILASNEFIYLR